MADVAVAPVRVAGKTVDWATTSQSEADRNRGRAIRRRNERLDKLDRGYRRKRLACNRGDPRSCRDAAEIANRIKALKTE